MRLAITLLAASACTPAELQVAARITDETLSAICAVQPLAHGVLSPSSIMLRRNQEGDLTPVKTQTPSTSSGASPSPAP